MSYYQKHVFICINQRDDAGRQCCARNGAYELFEYAKQKIRDLDLNGRGKVRINKAGCLNRCAEGPVLVVYPEGVWYHYKNQADIDEIIHEHVLNGRIVQRLQLES